MYDKAQEIRKMSISITGKSWKVEEKKEFLNDVIELPEKLSTLSSLILCVCVNLSKRFVSA